MDRDFRALVMVMVVGIVIMSIGTTLLLFAFRAFGTVRRGEIRHVVLLVVAIAFVLVCTIALLLFAIR